MQQGSPLNIYVQHFSELSVAHYETGTSRSRNWNKKSNTKKESKTLTFCFHCHPRSNVDSWSLKLGADTPRRRCGPPWDTASSECTSGDCASRPMWWPQAGIRHSICKQNNQLGYCLLRDCKSKMKFSDYRSLIRNKQNPSPKAMKSRTREVLVFWQA